MRFRHLLLAAALLPGALLRAAPPELKAFHPSGGQAGGELEVEAVAKFTPETWPPGIWTSREGVTFTPLDTPGKFRVAIAPDTPPGPLLVRLHNPEGPSPTRIFVVGELPEILENPDNNTPGSTQAVLESLPVVVNGRLEKSNDVDFYRLRGLKKGQTISARVDSYGLLAPNDPFLHLLDRDGHEIAYGSVSHNLDPRLSHVIPGDGDYFLQINALDSKAAANVSFVGGAERVYRIEIRPGPFLHPALPGAVGGEGDPLTTEGRLEGCLSTPGEIDRFILPAKKGEARLVRVESHGLHLPVDPVLRVLRPDGGELTRIDDVASRPDPEYLLKAAVDGDYIVEVSDRYRRGGPEYRYQILATEPAPAFAARTKADSLVVKAGGSAEWTVDMERLHGHQVPLKLEWENLPEHVTVEQPEFPAKNGSVQIKVSAGKEAGPWNAPVRPVVREVPADGAEPLGSAIRATFLTPESRGDYLINEHEYLWLTVVPEPEEKKPEEPAQE